MSGERLVVSIGATKPNYKAATLPSGQTVFVRKSTMRHGPAAWAELAAGDEVELAFKVCAGREIITDAVKLPVSGRQKIAVLSAETAAAQVAAPEHKSEPQAEPCAATLHLRAQSIRRGPEPYSEQPEPAANPVYEDDDVIARPSCIEGIGLFAKRRFEAGEAVLNWTPHVLTEDQFQSAGTVECTGLAGTRSDDQLTLCVSGCR